jgi:predicted DNA-binding protein (UPF0278 family)
MADVKPNFDLFLRQLKSRKADPVLRYIRSFINSFTNPQRQQRFTADQQAKLVQDFARFIFEQLACHEPFSVLNERELLNAKYGVEKLVMSKIHEYCYSPEMIETPQLHEQQGQQLDGSHQADLAVDEQLAQHYTQFAGRLTYRDLDVDEQLVSKGESFIQLAAAELNKVSLYKAPRAKIVCLLNACKILFQLIKNAHQHQNADEFLPLLVYTCLNAQVRHLYSNLKYIERFSFVRSSEAEYYLVSLSAAVEYIRQLKPCTEESQADSGA